MSKRTKKIIAWGIIAFWIVVAFCLSVVVLGVVEVIFMTLALAGMFIFCISCAWAMANS